MQRVVILAILVIAAGAVIFALNRPEPTPAERLSDAVQDVGDAAEDVVEELAAVAEDTVEAAKSEVEAKSEELQGQAATALEAVTAEVTQMSEDTRSQLEGLLQEWRDSGIVTDDGIDYDAATAAINASELSADAKTELIGLLTFVRDLPGDVDANLQALEQSL